MKHTSSISPVRRTIAIAAAAVVAIFSFAACSGGRRSLPVGVFDSGTGGFTVLEKLLALDSLGTEDFQYLADQANMPYGRYDAEGKAAYLTDLAVKDAFFLLDDGYYADASSLVKDCRKSKVKIIVIGCNTATAYGLQAIRDTLKALGSDVHVIGVVGAGVRSAISSLEGRYDKAAIGVLATPGTISSNVYERTIMEESAGKVAVSVVNQAGYGFAEAVDEERDFVDRSLEDFSTNYRGPVLGTGDADINPYLLDAYAFDYSDGKAFIERDAKGLPRRIQLNSSDNYARFNLVNLIDKACRAGLSEPLRCIILGCTHYPFLQKTMEEELAYLRSFQFEDGTRPYESVIAEDCIFIDPAQNTALECLRTLKKENLLSRKKTPGNLESFISVPSKSLPDSCIAPDGGLTYAYKYGREINDGVLSTVVVPMSENTVNSDNLERIGRLLPNCWKKLSESPLPVFLESGSSKL